MTLPARPAQSRRAPHPRSPGSLRALRGRRWRSTRCRSRWCPGSITGLIGPNGAGKTTLIDAVTGFTRPSGGTMLLDGKAINEWSAARRARRGLSRSFQSLELFEDSTVLDNLRVASDPRRPGVLLAGPGVPGATRASGRGGRRRPGVRPGGRPRPRGAGPPLRQAAPAGDRPRRGHPAERAAARRAGGRPGDAETSELATLVRRLAQDWGMAVLLIEHDMDFVMAVCDEIVVLDFGHKIAHGPAGRRPPGPAGDRRLPRPDGSWSRPLLNAHPVGAPLEDA